MDNDFFYPIHDIIPDREGHGMVIGKNGSLTYVVRLSSPEVYSLYKDELATRHAVFVQAFSHMPDNSWVHKQDIFRSLPFQSTGVGMSYLAKSDQEHFSGRKYLKHSCMIAFTLVGIQSLSSAYVKNIFSFKENLSGEDSERLDEFLSAVEFAINNLSALRNTRIDFLSLDELREYLSFPLISRKRTEYVIYILKSRLLLEIPRRGCMPSQTTSSCLNSIRCMERTTLFPRTSPNFICLLPRHLAAFISIITMCITRSFIFIRTRS